MTGTLSWCPSCREAIQDNYCANCGPVKRDAPPRMKLAEGCLCLLNAATSELLIPCWTHLHGGAP